MSVIFKAENHKYESLDPSDNTDWISVTTFISQFKLAFDSKTAAVKSSQNKRSKWYNLPVEEIENAWLNEGKRAVDLGTWYHNQREQDILGHDTIKRSGVDISIVKPIYDGLIKIAPDQKLTEGIYPEHFAYLKSAGICGQADRIEIIKDTLDVYDYKTNKEIKTESYKNWEGKKEKMLHCCSHLDNCNFNHYALQLSVYTYMILKHNPKYKPGKRQIHHIIFETDGNDKYGYPLVRKDSDDNPIVKEIVPYDIPYLKKEVIDMINWLHDNRANLKTK